MNDFQPDGGCQWSGGRCDDKPPRISPGGGWHTEPPRPAPVQTGTSCGNRRNYGWCTNGQGGGEYRHMFTFIYFAYLTHILCTSLSLIGVSCEWKHGSCRTKHNKNYAEVYGFTFRGVGYCTSRNGSFFDYETISWAKSIQQCATACVNRFSSNGRFRGINYLPAGTSSSNCNCMLGEDKITSAGSDDTELCYSIGMALRNLNLIQPIVHGIPTVKTDMTNRSVLMAMEIKNVSGCLAVQ